MKSLRQINVNYLLLVLLKLYTMRALSVGCDFRCGRCKVGVLSRFSLIYFAFSLIRSRIRLSQNSWVFIFPN